MSAEWISGQHISVVKMLIDSASLVRSMFPYILTKQKYAQSSNLYKIRNKYEFNIIKMKQ